MPSAGPTDPVARATGLRHTVARAPGLRHPVSRAPGLLHPVAVAPVLGPAFVCRPALSIRPATAGFPLPSLTLAEEWLRRWTLPPWPPRRLHRRRPGPRSWTARGE